MKDTHICTSSFGGDFPLTPPSSAGGCHLTHGRNTPITAYKYMCISINT